VGKMAKTEVIHVRISNERKKRIANILSVQGKNWGWAIEYGLDNVENLSIHFLKEKVEKLKENVSQCNTLMLEMQENVLQRVTKIDDLLTLYLNSGRDPVNPTRQDIFWINTKLKSIDGWDSDRFLSYVRSNNNYQDIRLEETTNE
jgi:hypothetical protein